MKPKNLSVLRTRRPLILGQIVCVGCATGDFWDAADWSLSLCRLAAKWFCVIEGRTSCYRQSRWQSARQPEPRMRNDEGSFKLAARLGSAALALPDVTITSQRGCQTPTRRPRALAAPWATSSVAQACEEKAPVFCRLRVPPLCFVSFRLNSATLQHFLTLRQRSGDRDEDPKRGRRFCEELRCFWKTANQRNRNIYLDAKLAFYSFFSLLIRGEKQSRIQQQIKKKWHGLLSLKCGTNRRHTD